MTISSISHAPQMHPAQQSSGLRLLSLGQLAQGGNWQLTLLHSVSHPLFLWITRGQGLAIINGMRSGVGVHNALYLPPGTLFSLDLGKQGFGQAVAFAADNIPDLPEEAQHLRIRDVMVQGALTTILEALQREQSSARPFAEDAISAQGQLLSVWLRRGMQDHPAPQPTNAAERLVHAYSGLVAESYHTGRPMADYAQMLAVTPTHLTRTCRQCSGRTAADFLTECSLHAARVMLATSNTAINQVSDSLGFSSAAYFTRFVQHHTGKTPSELRKASRMV